MRTNAAIAFCLACLLMMSPGRWANAAGDPDLANIKTNLLSYFTGAQADREDPAVAAWLPHVEQSARKALASLRADGSWADIDYSAGPDQEARLAGHLGRISTMAQGYGTPGQPLHGDPDLMAGVEKALVFIRPLVGVDCAKSGNWWYWQIQMPSSLGRTLLLMDGHLSRARVAEVEATMKYLLMEDALDAPRPSQAGYRHRTLLPVTGPTAGRTELHAGQNRIWVAMNHLYLALATEDKRRAEVAHDAFLAECRVQEGEGIKEDYSFHQHGPLLYTGGYGRGFSEDVAEYIWIARGTRYAIPEAGLDAFAHYVLDGAVWCIFDNYYDPSVRGREITRGNDRPEQLPLSLLVLANVPNPRRQEAVAAAKRFWEINPSFRSQVAPLWSAIRELPVSPSLPVGHRHYWESDYTVHRGADYFASLRMFSDRTKAAELINGEGLNCWHLSDGLLWVFLHGGDYVTHDVLPTLDWLRLPGTTVERRQLKPAEGYDEPPRPAARAFVGGIFTEDCGVSAMELAAAASPLTARKSWFFFGDEVVCLGSHIDCPTDNAAETIVNQWPLTAPAAPLTVDGQVQPSSLPWYGAMQDPKWAHCDGIGYYFPEPQRLQVKREVQKGTWRSMTESGDDTVRLNPFLTLWIDHGAQAKNATYAYAVLPAKTADQTEAYAASHPLTLLAHDSKVHAVRQNQRGAVGVVFWEPGAAGQLSVDRPCIAYYEQTEDDLTLAVSDPTHQASTFRVTVEESLMPMQLPPEVECSVLDGRTVLACHTERGRNYRAHFRRRRGNSDRVAAPWSQTPFVHPRDHR